MPTAVSLAEIDEEIEGKLVKITGEVIETRGNYVFIDDGTDEVVIYIKASTNINKSIFTEGDKVEVVGIVSQTKNGDRLLPRYDTDILKIGSVKGEQAVQESNKPTNQVNQYFIAIIIFMGVIIGWLAYKQYKLKINSKIS